MRIKHLTTSFTCLFVACVHAQPVIHAADHLPLAGGSRVIHVSNVTNDPPSGGADVVWDYSGLGTGSQITMQYLNAQETEFGPQMSGAQVAVDANGDVRFFGHEVGVGLMEHGIQVSLCGYAWSDPMLLLPPVTAYGDSWSDDYQGSCQMALGTMQRSGTYTAAADGWGTLLLPGGELGNVLRVRGEKHYTDRFGDPIGSYREVICEYYVSTVVEPVLSTIQLFLTMGGTELQMAHAANYIHDPSLGSGRLDNASDMLLYPNPARNNVLITRSAAIAPAVLVVDAMGRVVISEKVASTNMGRIYLDVGHLAPGAYTVRCTDEAGRVAIRKLVKE